MDSFNMVQYHQQQQRKEYLLTQQPRLSMTQQTYKPQFILESEKLHSQDLRNNVIRVLCDSYDEIFSIVMDRQEFVQLLKSYIKDMNDSWLDFESLEDDEILQDFESYWNEQQSPQIPNENGND